MNETYFVTQNVQMRQLYPEVRGDVWLVVTSQQPNLTVHLSIYLATCSQCTFSAPNMFVGLSRGRVDDSSFFEYLVHFVFCQLSFIVLFPFLIKDYHILFIIIVFWLGCDRPSGLL